VIQRVRVRCGADVRGSQHAKLRSGLPDAFTLPGIEPGDVVARLDVVDIGCAGRASCVVSALGDASESVAAKYGEATLGPTGNGASSLKIEKCD